MASSRPSDQSSLFADQAPRPLADQLRPRLLSEVVGQDHLLGPDAVLGRMLEAGTISSLIFWGPPGCGKTTIARLLADHVDAQFQQISAIFSGVADLKKLFAEAKQDRQMGRRTLLFVDEIHRFNRAQQDGFLPFVEDGTVTLVGATTENPSFELNAALLSRAQVLVLKRLDEDALRLLLRRGEEALGLKGRLFSDEAETAVLAMADGDGRYLINLIEQASMAIADAPLSAQLTNDLLRQRPAVYDKGQESHYNLISALHKAMRGSDVDAALYWLARMLAGGEDPNYIARRVLRFAFEDVGLADPQATPIALAAWQSYERIGSPEGELAIAQAVIYLATAPKSNAGYAAYKASVRSAKEYGSLMPPMHAVNAPTKLMKQLGYSQGYDYDHNHDDGFAGQNYFPDDMPRTQFYEPVERGFEREIRKRLTYFEKLRHDR